MLFAGTISVVLVLTAESCCYVPFVDCFPRYSLLQVERDTIHTKEEIVVLFKAHKRDNPRAYPLGVSMHIQSDELDLHGFKPDMDATETFVLINGEKIQPAHYWQFMNEDNKSIELQVFYEHVSSKSLVPPGIEFRMKNFRAVSETDTITFSLTNRIYDLSKFKK